jgi:prepilin-type N-terminal cleavage/methylation domain-containing protein
VETKLKHQRGMTLLETLVVVGLIGAIALIAIPILLNTLNSYKTQTAASGFAVHLRFARNAAVKQKLRYKILIAEDPDNAYCLEQETDFDSGVYKIVKGLGTESKTVGGTQYIALPKGVKITTSSTDGPIVFNYRGANDASITYNIYMETTKVRYTITVTPTGGIYTTRKEL